MVLVYRCQMQTVEREPFGDVMCFGSEYEIREGEEQMRTGTSRKVTKGEL